MHVYNAIIILKEIISVFPLADVINVGAEIDAVMNNLIETEDRGDLKILARAYAISAYSASSRNSLATHSYSASLKKRESLWLGPKQVTKVRVEEFQCLVSV